MTLNHILGLPRRSAVIALLCLVTAVVAHATELLPVVNGDFETLTPAGSTQFGTGAGGPFATLDGWTTTGYNFIFEPGTADTTGTSGQYGTLTLWGPNDGSNNGLPATSPLGGNFIGADGAFEVGSIDQVVTGLTVGEQYALPFFYAGAQQHGYNGLTTEQWVVSLGSETYSTRILVDGSHGFTGWKYEDFTFTATATSETLSFLAVGTPGGEPPFSLLDGVGSAIAPIPEPASLAMLFTGLASVGGMVRARVRKPRA